MTIKDLLSIMYKLTKISYTLKEKESLWESFKIKPNIEDNPDNLDDRLVSL